MKPIDNKLKEKALGYFKLYPNAKALCVTSDGNVFLTKSMAKNHVNSSKKELDMYEVERPDAVKHDVGGSDNEDDVDQGVGDLMKKTRDWLNAYAVEKGMDKEQAESYDTKALLIEAIEKLIK